jgi:hypothetical protein
MMILKKFLGLDILGCVWYLNSFSGYLYFLLKEDNRHCKELPRRNP